MTSVQDRPTTSTEPIDTSKVPFRIEDPLMIPSERYYDPAFLAAERSMWLHTWQLACHGTEVPKAGDFTEYQILDQSIMIIRQEDGSVKAFHNSCRHRGTALACGTGSFRAGTVICPFHGWRWSLDGTNTYVYAKRAFRDETVEQADVDLSEVQVAERYGFVWINLDADAAPFSESTNGIEVALEPNGFEKMHVTWWHQIEFKANWKVAQEAFFEGYHVMQTHGEMAGFLRDEDYNALAYGHYKTDPQGHGWVDVREPLTLTRPGQIDSLLFTDPSIKTPGELYVATQRAMWEGAQSQTNAHYLAIAEELLENDPGDLSFYMEMNKRAYASAAERNVPLPAPSPDRTAHWTLFPHFTGVVNLGCALAYRSRPHPTDPSRCVYDFWALEIPPEGTPVRRPTIAADDAPTWDDLWFVQQDASNIERIQTGLRNQGLTHARLGPDVEKMIVNWHQSLDREIAKHL